MRTTTVVIGAGHAGLAMSRCLAERSIDHVVLERGEVANSWRTERWDSLRLLTPNWQSRLPGFGYEGDDPDGFRTMPETVEFIERYAQAIAAPVETGTRGDVGARATTTATRSRTDRGDWRCRTRGARHRRLQRRRACRRSPAAVPPLDRDAHAAWTTAIPASSPTAACSSSARRRPASSSPTRSTAPAAR